jgi:hypothetical protein
MTNFQEHLDTQEQYNQRERRVLRARGLNLSKNSRVLVLAHFSYTITPL